MKIRRCNRCLCIDTTDEFTIKWWRGRKSYQCPICGGNSTLVDNRCTFGDNNLEDLWIMFGNIAIDDQDRIQESFLGFAKGTDRLDIWNWFEERYPEGVAQLIVNTGSLWARAEK